MSLLYEIKDRYTFLTKGWLTDDSTSTGVSLALHPEPTFRYDLFKGPGELQIRIGSNPLAAPLNAQLFPFDLITAHHSDGRTMGVWKFDQASEASRGQAKDYILHCSPLCAELSEVPYGANYTATGDDQDHQPALGAAHFDVPAIAAIGLTKHCTVRDVNSDVVNYAMLYRKDGRAIDTLAHGADQGGQDWWWYCSGLGGVDLRGGARTTWNMAWITNVHREESIVFDATQIFNVQDVNGALVNDTVTFAGVDYAISRPLRGHATRTDASAPGTFYTVEKIGTRAAPVWTDISATTQTDVDTVAASILARRSSEIVTFVVRLFSDGSTAQFPAVQPGDQVNYTRGLSMVINGVSLTTIPGLWVTTVEEFGSSGVQRLTLRTMLDLRERPFRSQRDVLSA